MENVYTHSVHVVILLAYASYLGTDTYWLALRY